jgi:hypothetical protein
MHSQLEAGRAAMAAAALCRLLRPVVLPALAAAALGGCLPTAPLLSGADPADPGVKVAGVGYRSTIAPYSSLRPATPASWRGQSGRGAPKSEP